MAVVDELGDNNDRSADVYKSVRALAEAHCVSSPARCNRNKVLQAIDNDFYGLDKHVYARANRHRPTTHLV